MPRRIKQFIFFRAAIFFIFCLAALPGNADSFEFNWPAPSEVRITEKTSLNGITLEMHMKANFAKRPQAKGYAFAVQDIDLVEVKGVPDAHQAELILTTSFWPTYLVSESGKLIGLSGMETATKNMMLISQQLDRDRAKKAFDAPEFQDMLRDRVAMFWKGLVGAIAGMQLESGEKKTRNETVGLHGIKIPARITVEHLGMADEVTGAVRVRTVINYDEDGLQAAIDEVLSTLMGSEAIGSLLVRELQQQVSFDSVLSPDTLLPHTSMMVDTLSLRTESDEELEIRQRMELRFDWVY